MWTTENLTKMANSVYIYIYIYIYIYMHVFTQSLCPQQDVTQG